MAKDTKPTKTPVAKVTKKAPAPKKKKAPAKPKPKAFTEELAEAWFLKLPQTHFKLMCEEWNNRNFKVKLPRHDNYDDWLNYFKTLPPTTIQQLIRNGRDFIPTEGYTALSRWFDIIANPQRIDKIHQAGLANTAKKAKNHKTIVELALANDRLGVLQATRQRIAERLEKGAGARDTAALAREMTEIMTQIADYEKRLGPKKNTVLGQLMEDIPDFKNPTKRNKNSGTRNTSFKSRITIEDAEAVNGNS